MNYLNWDKFLLGDKRVSQEICSGFACGTKDTEAGVPHLRMNNISTDGSVDFSLVRRIPIDIAEMKNRWLKPGDVLFCNTNSTALVGKTSLFLGWSEQCTFSNHLTRIRVNHKNVSSKWLALCLKELWINKHFSTNCKEFIGQSSFSNDKLKNVEIPIPSLPEQRHIVARMEKLTCRAEEVQKITVKREAELDTLLQATYFKMIDGVEWKPLREVASLIRRPVKTKPNEKWFIRLMSTFGCGDDTV